MKDNQVSDPPEQEPLESLHVERPDLDESATTPCPEHRSSSTLSRQGSDDGQDYMHLSGLSFADKDSQQEDDDAVSGCEVQPDDVPDGLYDWSQDDLVPCLKTLCVSLEFIKGLEGASLANDPIPDDVCERLRSPFTMLPHIDNDLRMCLGIFMKTVNGSQATYDGVCQFIKQWFPDAQTQSYDQMKQTSLISQKWSR